jgi:hypothetical protein
MRIGWGCEDMGCCKGVGGYAWDQLWGEEKGREGVGPEKGFSRERGRDLPERRGGFEKLGCGEGETNKGASSVGSGSKVDGRGLGAEGEGES